jgi:hypothetical protein
MTVIP